MKIGSWLSRCFREETHMLEMPLEDPPVTIALLENKSAASKPVPVATVRSPKLAAMAASMNKVADTESEIDLETSMDMDEDAQESDSNLVKLEDILIVPEMMNEENVECNQNEEYNENNGGGNDNTFDQFNRVEGNTEQDKQRVSYTNGAEKKMEEKKDNSNGAGTSNDLSLSCVNSGMPDATYRFGSM